MAVISYHSASFFYAKILKILHISKEIDIYFADIQLININSVNPKYRILTLSEIDDDSPKKAKKDGSQLKVWCPECKDNHRHRSLQYDVKTGAFYCFYCGLHGRIQFGTVDNDKPLYSNTISKPISSKPISPKGNKISSKDFSAKQTDETATRLTDYVSLSDDILATIADISLDPNEKNSQQLAVRRYLEEQKISLQRAHNMRWGVANIHVKLKDEEQGKLRTCVVYRNYVDGICCNAKFRTVSRIRKTVIRNGQQVQIETVEKGFTQESAFTPTAPYNIDCINPKKVDGLWFLVDSKVYGSGFMVYGDHPDDNSINYKPSARLEETLARARTINPQQESINHKPSSINPNDEIHKPLTINHKPSSINPDVEIHKPLTINHKPLIITEGEKDCLTLRHIGFRYVISMSNGAQTDPQKTFEAFRSWLEPFRKIVICGDKDKPGRQMVQRLTEYFDDREVFTVDWDQRQFGKDITELFQLHGEELARDIVLHAEPVLRNDIVDYCSPEDMDEICNMGCDPERADKYSVGIGPLTDRHFMLTPEGGLIIVTGTPNTGKTDWLNFLTTLLMAKRGSDVCYCSFETPNKKRHLARLAQEWIGSTPAQALTREQHLQFVRCVVEKAHHLRLRRERPTAANILRKAETVLRKHPRMEYLVIDPYLYMDLGRGRGVTETEAIKEMLPVVQEWAQDHHVWVFIVAHPRKLNKEDGTDEFERIDMYTIAGSANWANIADYILTLERVRKDDGRVDYTRMDVLKVRDQEVCTPGTVYYQRQTCGRYDERKDIEACTQHRGTNDVQPWPLF